MSTHTNNNDPPEETASQSKNTRDQTSDMEEETVGDEQVTAAPTYKRVGRVEPTEPVIEALDQISSEFILSDPPDEVGGNIDDTERVRQCLTTAIEYFHNNLPSEVRKQIKQKWGINDEMINTRKIGYVDDSNDIVEFLLDKGFDPLTISRAGLATETRIKHLFESDGVSSENAHIVAEERRDAEVDENCTYSVGPVLEALVRAQLQGLITPEEIDLEAVSEHLQENDNISLWNWWDNRITFPYRDEGGEFCYLIVRATGETDDIIYNNGITDRSGKKYTPLNETRLGEEILSQHDVSDSDLEEYAVLPHNEEPFNTPDEDEHEEPVEEIMDVLFRHLDESEDVPEHYLPYVGIDHIPRQKRELEQSEIARVHLFETEYIRGDYDSRFILSPPAIGLSPGDGIELVNHTQYDAELDILGTPDDVWWSDGSVDDIEAMMCDKRGMYRYEINVHNESHNGIAVCYDDVYTERRNYQVEQWVGDEPGFEVDMAKYIKQTIDRSWINHDAIVEPIFGCETVHEGRPLIVTEGVTDAIVAHQHNLPCVAPATTNFKQHHYDKICELAEDVSNVFVVNDNEISNAGINGALRTAKVIENAGHTVTVGELPRPDGWEKIDLAEYLKHHTRSDLIDLLQDGIPPEKHELYDPERHDPNHTHGDQNTDYDSGSGSRSDSTFTGEFDASNASALYSLSLEDVIDFQSLDLSGRSGSTIYRGENPIQHHGNSTGYFVIRDHGEFLTAKDYKIESNGDGYYYNALTWLACEASCACDPRESCDCTRTTTRPMGSLTDSEIWWAWRHAKESEHIPFPDDDRVPVRAIWFLAQYHEVIPEEYIPDSFEDGKELPESKYNSILDIIETEYGIDSGRERIPTSEG